MKEFDLSKLSSGKFWLTIITGLVFAYVSVRHILGAEAISTICGMVFISYFQKNGGDNVQKTTTVVKDTTKTTV